jgi:hypothetical protein
LCKKDFERLLRMDRRELRCTFKLTDRHLNAKGKQKQRVFLAAQLFSRTTATAWRKAFPNQTAQADFIELVNDWIDVFNSHNPEETLNKKMPYGLNLEVQDAILDKMFAEIQHLRVGSSERLYPFQGLLLTSILSLKGLYADLSGSHLRINYILTHRVNQDFIENAFSINRKTGAYNDNPSPIDAKHRLKLLILSWGGKCSEAAPVAMDLVKSLSCLAG